MTDYKKALLESKHFIGEYCAGDKGPTIIALAGIHGNEPASIKAVNVVLKELQKGEVNFKGRFIGLVGNVDALKISQRYVDEDMNRFWPAYIRERYHGSSHEVPVEDSMRHGLINVIYSIAQHAQHPLLFFDLHSTSAPTVPFAAINDSLFSRKLVKDLSVPVILGLEEQIEGTLNGLLNDLGIASIIFEAGQHDDLETEQNHIAFLWYMVHKLSATNKNAKSNIKKYKSILKHITGNKAGYYEVKYRHVIHQDDIFKMKPGYQSFETISKNEWLAEQNNEQILSPARGKIFMPLYQGKGNDGFFLLRKIRPFWIAVSKWLRLKKMDKYLHLLPGVHQHPEKQGVFIINEGIAFIFALQLFHLLGFRKEHKIDEQLYVSRIRYDFEQPSKAVILKNFKALLKLD